MLNFGFVTPKGTSLPRTASFDVFCVKICWGILAVRDFLNPKNRRVNNLVCEVAHAQKQNHLSNLDQILQGGRYPRRMYVCMCMYPSGKGPAYSGPIR